MNFTPFDTIWLATATACFGSQASSPTFRTSFSPRVPPAALTCAPALSAARFICVLHRHCGAAFHLLAEARILPGDGADDSYLKISPGCRGGERHRKAEGN